MYTGLAVQTYMIYIITIKKIHCQTSCKFATSKAPYKTNIFRNISYGSWVVISIVLFDISKNDPLLVPYTCILKSIRARSKQLILK
jgi:hypothetical protein